MAERMHRTQVLLKPAQHAALARIAAQERRSVSEVLRDLIDQVLAERESAAEVETRARLEAFERIRQHRAEILAANGGKPLAIDTVAWLEEAREEQDERNFSIVFGRGH